MTDDASVGTEDLERRLRDGDQQALAELFTAERERLWRVIHFRMAEPLRGRLSPEDVLQEAFLAASQRLKHYAESPASSPFIWLRMMVNQTLIDLHRRHLGAQQRDAAREVSLDGCGLLAGDLGLRGDSIGRSFHFAQWRGGAGGRVRPGQKCD